MATGRIGTTPTLRTRWSKQPAGGTTSLSGLDDNSVSLVYDVGYEAVYRNGVLLSRGNDYTATSGTSITLIDATIAGDVIEVFANQSIPLTDTYTQTVADGKFINNTLVDAKGDILTATADNTPARLAVGANDTVLTADSSTATGLKWATPAAGGMTLLSTTSLTGASVTVSSINQTYRDLQIVVEDLFNANNQTEVGFRFNADATANRHQAVVTLSTSNSSTQPLSSVRWFYGVSNSASYKKMGVMTIPNYANTTNLKFAFVNSTGFNAFDLANLTTNWFVAGYNQATAISSFSLFPDSGNFSGGTVKVYGVK